MGGANAAIRSVHDYFDRIDGANAEDEDVHQYVGNSNDIGRRRRNMSAIPSTFNRELNLFSAGDNARIIGGTEVRH